jgi:hypothetical protein
MKPSMKALLVAIPATLLLLTPENGECRKRGRGQPAKLVGVGLHHQGIIGLGAVNLVGRYGVMREKRSRGADRYYLFATGSVQLGPSIGASTSHGLTYVTRNPHLPKRKTIPFISSSSTLGLQRGTTNQRDNSYSKGNLQADVVSAGLLGASFSLAKGKAVSLAIPVSRKVALKLARNQDALGQAVSDLVQNYGWRLSPYYHSSRYVDRMMKSWDQLQ